jgi:Putative transmembrane protein (PGPGW)
MLEIEAVDKRSSIVRYAKVTAGFALLPVGVAMIVLPGPGLPVVACSLLLLEDEFIWAGKARTGMTQLARRVAKSLNFRGSTRIDPPILAPAGSGPELQQPGHAERGNA